MTSIISSMLQSLFPSAQFRGLFIGLDASGKTTILYKLKLGEVITTMPTIGFNVETVNLSGIELTMWDVGGCDKIRPLWRHYYKNTQAVVFIVDCNDKDRFDESCELFRDTVNHEELIHAHILILFNKIDLSPDAGVDIMEKFRAANESTLTGREFNMHAVSACSGDGLLEGFGWLVSSLTKKPFVPPLPPAAPELTEKDKLELQLEEWLNREDDPDEEFLSKLRDFTLDSWDHYTHLRIAFILLNKHGRRDGMKLIFGDIKTFIENSPRTRRGGPSSGSGSNNNRGTTFHETMTYFWVHMVHYAIESSRAAAHAFKTIETIGKPSQRKAASNEWKIFLLMNPQLSNGGLFLHYYSKHRMLLDPDARSMVLLPDKIPLPSLLVDPHQVSQSKEHDSSSTGAKEPKKPLTDAEFLQLLAENKLPGWGHEVKLRIIYLLLCSFGRSSRSMDFILNTLRGIEKEGFHLTLSYFWVQLMTYHMAVELKEIRSNGSGEIPIRVLGAFSDASMLVQGDLTLQYAVELTAASSSSAAAIDDCEVDAVASAVSCAGGCMAFSTFLLQPHCQPLRNSLLYNKYYSRRLIDSEASSTEFIMPDLKSLPSIV